MKNKNVLVAAILMAGSSIANAATWTPWSMISPSVVVDNSVSWNQINFQRQNEQNGNLQNSYLRYQGTAASEVKFLTGLNGQDASSIATSMNSVFSLTGSNALVSTSTSSSFNDTGFVLEGDMESKNAFTIDTDKDDFNYLSIHMGLGNVFLKFASPITKLIIASNGQAAGLSGFRAFDNVPNLPPPPSIKATPVPAAVWLFGSGLVGLVASKRKKAA